MAGSEGKGGPDGVFRIWVALGTLKLGSEMKGLGIEK